MKIQTKLLLLAALAVASVACKKSDALLRNTTSDTPDDPSEVIVPVTGLSFNLDRLGLASTESFSLPLSVTPSNANDSVTVISSDESVAIYKDGTVYAMGSGTASITAFSGNVYSTCVVDVTALHLDEATFEWNVTTADSAKYRSFAPYETLMVNLKVVADTTTLEEVDWVEAEFDVDEIAVYPRNLNDEFNDRQAYVLAYIGDALAAVLPVKQYSSRWSVPVLKTNYVVGNTGASNDVIFTNSSSTDCKGLVAYKNGDVLATNVGKTEASGAFLPKLYDVGAASVFNLAFTNYNARARSFTCNLATTIDGTTYYLVPNGTSALKLTSEKPSSDTWTLATCTSSATSGYLIDFTTTISGTKYSIQYSNGSFTLGEYSNHSADTDIHPYVKAKN